MRGAPRTKEVSVKFDFPRRQERKIGEGDVDVVRASLGLEPKNLISEEGGKLLDQWIRPRSSSLGDGIPCEPVLCEPLALHHV